MTPKKPKAPTLAEARREIGWLVWDGKSCCATERTKAHAEITRRSWNLHDPDYPAAIFRLRVVKP